MIIPLACETITSKNFWKKKCALWIKKKKEKKRDEIKFGMTSIPLRHTLLGVALWGTCYKVLPFEIILLPGKLASKVSMIII